MGMVGGFERVHHLRRCVVHTPMFRHPVQLLDERVWEQQERNQLDNFPDDRVRLLRV